MFNPSNFLLEMGNVGRGQPQEPDDLSEYRRQEFQLIGQHGACEICGTNHAQEQLQSIFLNKTLRVCQNCLVKLCYSKFKKFPRVKQALVSVGHCEACKGPIQNILTSTYDGVTYKLCTPCFIRLVGKSLQPAHYKNIVKHGHSRTEYHIHDDFYDDRTGKALQPKF